MSQPSKRRIASRFGRAAHSYDSDATVQREITELLAKLIKNDIGMEQLWCDIGSATGTLLSYLTPLPDKTRFVCLDLAFSPLRRAREQNRCGLAINGDIDFPPVRPLIFDGAVAASMLQWIVSPELALRKMAELLKTNGSLYFSVFAKGSFNELNAVRANRGLNPAVWLPSEDDLFSIFENAGFDILKESVQQFNRVLYFTDATSALKNLSNIGATATNGKLLNKRELDELCRDYTSMFSYAGAVSMTYHAIIGIARKGSCR
ncbi:MAG: methyltransferase domain-containing protein [Chitinispirillales bacterium]|nr:methyltransferase domain-containing protein [Chitinispirillales bacterium]